MKICIVAATAFELADLRNKCSGLNLDIDFFVHGVGILSSTFHLTQYFQANKPQLAIQCGVAGSYTNASKIGDVVIVESEELGDAGAELASGEILDLFALNLMENSKTLFLEKKLWNTHLDKFQTSSFIKVQGLTVNCCSGTAATIHNRIQTFHADIETMEGAPFHYICKQFEIPFLQIRGISNVVEPRNKEHWNMPLAIHQYSEALYKFIETL